MESPLTSRLVFRDSDGNVVAVPTEWTIAQIEVLVPIDDWENSTLTLQHCEIPLSLTKLRSRACVVAPWPRANAGHYSLELTWPGGCERRIVTIAPRKISEASFARMLTDLEIVFPAAIAISLQRLGAFAGINILPPGQGTLANEVTRLHRAIAGTETRAGLAAVLEDIADRPHQVLKPFELWVKSNQARRPHAARIKDAIHRGYNLSADKLPITLLDTRVEHTFDVYENRLVRFFVQQVELRLKTVSRAISNSVADSHLLQTVRTLQSRLQNARRRASFLNSVSLLADLPTNSTMVLLKTPAYRAAFQGYLEFRQCYAVQIAEPRLDAPLENLPALYQLWGTMVVIQVLLECAKAAGYRIAKNRLVVGDRTGLWIRVLPGNSPAIELVHPQSDVAIRLFPERKFGKAPGLHSISFQQQPDIAVEIESSDATRVLLFDPKYKLRSEENGDSLLNDDELSSPGIPKKVDIDKMHAYRDAIRDSDLRRAVSYAAILYPGAEVRYADDIEALRTYPGEMETLTSRLREVIERAIKRVAAVPRMEASDDWPEI